jgi:hypothetical protein
MDVATRWLRAVACRRQFTVSVIGPAIPALYVESPEYVPVIW